MNSDPGHRCPPPPAGLLDPLTIVIPANTRLLRVHADTRAPDEFNPGTGSATGRFHPFKDTDRVSVPTLYAADSIQGALSETVFHDVVGNGGRIRASRLAPLIISTLILRADVELADLTGHGLRRIGLQRDQLLECNASEYSNTARWAEALHSSRNAIQGLNWVSRQFDTAKAMVFFGDRTARDILQPAGDSTSLAHGEGLEWVRHFAVLSDIRIVEG